MSPEIELPFFHSPIGDAIVEPWLKRGWRTIDLDHEAIYMRYSHTLNAKFEDMPYYLSDLGFRGLECTLIHSDPESCYTATLEIFGITGGCKKHRTIDVIAHVKAGLLPACLEDVENLAREVDTDALAVCFLFGQCAEMLNLYP